MAKDFVWGATMSICVALVPNLLQLLMGLSSSPVNGADKLLIVSMLALGAATSSPPLFGSKGIDSLRHGYKIAFGYPALLFVSGIAASAYFIVVIGLGDRAGFGAGLAETIDGSLSPCIYLVWVTVGPKIWSALGPQTEKLSIAGVIGMVLIALGLFVVGISPITSKEATSLALLQRPEDAVLAGLGVLGAIGTAFSLWSLRRIKNKFEANLGFAVMLRYGGVAIAFLLWSFLLFRSEGQFTVSLPVCFAAFLIGAVLINGAYFAAVRIDGEAATAAALASVPLLTFAVEGLLHISALVNSQIRFESSWWWVGVVSATAGIVALRMPKPSKRPAEV